MQRSENVICQARKETDEDLNITCRNSFVNRILFETKINRL